MLEYDDWMALATEEYRRLGALLRELTPDEWGLPTDCEAWDVRAMVAHLVGAAAGMASVPELARQAVLGLRARDGRDLVDGMNDVQVRERAGRTPAQLVDDLAATGARAMRARRRLPAPVRAVPLPFGPPLGVRPLGYLMGRIYTRDAWMHRIDVCRATGHRLVLTPDHDGRIVADLVEEWAAQHGAPYALLLTGPAGGHWTRGDGVLIELDAVDFARTLAGRATGEGLLAERVPF